MAETGEQRAAGAEGRPRKVWSRLAPWRGAWAGLWQDVRTSDRRAMRLLLAGAGLVVSAYIGYVYARDIMVDGWQLWAWGICVVVAVVALLPAGRMRFRLEPVHAWLLGLLVLAVLLRVPNLETVPGGLHVDEMGVADFALRHVFPQAHSTVSPFRPGPASQPALYHYLIRLSLLVGGNSIAGLRLLNALVGSLAVLATYAVIAVLDNRRTAALGALVMSTYFYHVHWSRIALNNIWDTLWVPLIVAAYVWGWKRNWSGGAVLAGLSLGLAQYFYAGNKIAIFLLIYLVIWLYRQDPDRRRLLVHTGKLALTAAVVAAPTLLCALRDPQPYFDRARIVFGWQASAIAEVTGGRLDFRGYLEYFWHQLTRSVGAYVAVPDVTGFFRPGVPFLVGLAAPLFVVGIVWALRQRQPIPVVWIALITFFGGIMLTGAPSSSHLIACIPAVCWLVAVPLAWLWDHGPRPLAVFALVVIMAFDLLFYFRVYLPLAPHDLEHAFPPWP